MSDDIVDRLAEWASIGWDARVDPYQKYTDDTLDHDISEAAGEIVRLRTRVAELEAGNIMLAYWLGSIR